MINDIEYEQVDMFGAAPEICTVSNASMKTGLENIEDKSFLRYCEKHVALINKLAEIGLPERGQQFRLVTKRSFNSIQIIEYITSNEIILDLKMCVYSINYHAAVILVNLINARKIQKCEILMSNLRNKAHREKEEITKKMFMDNPHIDLFFASAHAKTFSCKTDKGNFYTIEGSGNMSYNSRVEQYVIDNDELMYNFSCDWMAEIKEFLEDINSKELEVC